MEAAPVIRRRIGDAKDASEISILAEANPPAEMMAKHQKLGQLRATCLAGNDLLGSVFYTIGVCTQVTGPLAPVSLGLVTVVLFFFRAIYSEIGILLPKNGGTYQCLINATTPFAALIAGICSILSYIATCVVSASTMASYAASESSALNVYWLTILTIAAVGLLNLFGLSDSAMAATFMFLTHFFTLIVLMCACAYRISVDGTTLLTENYRSYSSEIDNKTIAYNLFIGYCLGMLGITGFETSSNYIENQKPGVYPKTIRNMWVLVTIFNPTLSFLSLFVTPLHFYQDQPESVLAITADRAAGSWLRICLVVDACVVLVGGVLTAFVGVAGVAERLARDRYLPSILVRRNPRTDAPDAIILAFGSLCILLYLLVNGNSLILGGMFAISFLSVMTLFAIGNVMLKLRRSRMPRQYSASWIALFIGFFSTCAAILGNILASPIIIVHFCIFFAIVSGIVTVTVYRQSLRHVTRKWLRKHKLIKARTASALEMSPFKRARATVLPPASGGKAVNLGAGSSSVTSREGSSCEESDFDEELPIERGNVFRNIGIRRERVPVIFLLSRPNVRCVGNALHYCEWSAKASHTYLVHFCDHPAVNALGEHPDTTAALPTSVVPGTTEVEPVANQDNSHACGVKRMWNTMRSPFQHLHPKMEIELVVVHGSFSPRNLKTVCETLDVQHNFVFLRAPGPNFAGHLGDFGEMRIII
jgi:amino acid transporter